MTTAWVRPTCTAVAAIAVATSIGLLCAFDVIGRIVIF
jgi:hypothetical protein